MTTGQTQLAFVVAVPMVTLPNCVGPVDALLEELALALMS